MHATAPQRHAALPDRVAPGRATRRAAVALGVWAAWYATYRFYYAFGGRLGMIGQPSPAAHFRRDNFVGGAILLLAALLPWLTVRGWRHWPVRRLVPVAGWVTAVGCCMHALTLVTLRVLSLTGVHPTDDPPGLRLSIDRRKADLQDLLLFNEPWFFVEGCLWAVFALTALQPASRQRRRRSAAVACLLATVVGVASGLGAISNVPSRLTVDEVWARVVPATSSSTSMVAVILATSSSVIVVGREKVTAPGSDASTHAAAVKDFMRHAKITTTKRYLHARSRRTDAARLMKGSRDTHLEKEAVA